MVTVTTRRRTSNIFACLIAWILIHLNLVRSVGNETTFSGSKVKRSFNFEGGPSHNVSAVQDFIPMPKVKIFVTTFSKLQGGDAEIGLSCQWSKVPFKNGSYWVIEYSDGSQQKFTGKSQDNGVNRTHRMDSVIRAKFMEIDKFICSVPYSTSEKWINYTLAFTAPKIINASKDQEFYDTDQNKMIFCDVFGSPPPNVTWHLNNRSDSIVFDETQNIITVYTELHNPPGWRCSLYFNKTTSNVENVYTCNATNYKGEDLRYIRLKITPYSTSAYWMLAMGCLLATLVVAFPVYVYKLWKIQKRLDEEIMKNFDHGQPLLAHHGGNLDDFGGPGDRHLAHSNSSDGLQIALGRCYDKDRYEKKVEDLVSANAKELGSGHYGTVVLKSLKENEEIRPVAVKVLPKWNREHAQILLEEIKILCYVNEGNDENVVGFVGAITRFLEQNVQIIMEYCAKGSLKDFLIQNQDHFTDTHDQVFFNEEPNTSDVGIRTFDLIYWSYQFARGMEYLASKKIIHGDLAARNLLLTHERQLKISDFGLSKLKKYPKNEDILNLELAWPALALECMKGKTMSIKSDVWAFGITLWEIFSLGEEPYSLLTPKQLYLTLALGERLPRPNVSSVKIYEIMSSCWTELPEERPEFSSLADELLRILRGPTVMRAHNRYMQGDQVNGLPPPGR